MTIITDLFLLLILLNSALFSLPLTHLLLVWFQPPSLYLVLCGKYKHIFKSVLKKPFYYVMSNGWREGEKKLMRTEEIINDATYSFIMLYMSYELGNDNVESH